MYNIPVNYLYAVRIMAEKSDIIDLWLDTGLDIKNRRISFGLILEGEEDGATFSWRSVETAIRHIQLLEKDAPNKPIELHMSSPGGDAYEMQRLIDVIEASPCQIKFYGGGMIASAAVWIMACCDERYLYRGTRVLVHDSGGFSTEVSAKIVDAAISVEEDANFQRYLNQVFADNSRMPVEFWEEIVKRDLWLTAEETVLLGLADKIIEPKKRGNLRRMRISHLKKDVDKKVMTKFITELNERIHSSKLLKLQLHTPKEHFDSKVFVDSSPIETPEDLPESPKKD